MFCIAFRVTIELGLRRGELGGLEWSDINFKDNLVTIKDIQMQPYYYPRIYTSKLFKQD